LCGLGLGQLLALFPQAVLGLKIFGTCYLTYLAWKVIGLNLGDGTLESSGKPMSTLQALIFQFSNPKAWMMATTGLNISIGMDGSMLTAVVVFAACFLTLGLACNVLWLYTGASLQSLWQQKQYQRIINGALALLTILTIAMFWWA